MPTVLQLDNLVAAAIGVITRCRLDGPGRYKRYAVAVDQPASTGLNPYGVADAANLLYTLNEMPHDEADHRAFITALQNMQDPDTGLYHEHHHPYHTTAHCIAALELFEALPSHPLHEMQPFATPEGITQLLEELNWTTSPWNMSHRGAGVYVSLKLSRQLPPEVEQAWEQAYFDWVTREFDPDTGLLRRGCLPGQAADAFPIHGHMAGTFHYLFNMESARVPLPYPAALVDTCLMMERDDRCPELASAVSFITVDWIFCLNRALRQSGHRHAEALAALRRVADRFVDYLNNLDHDRDEDFNDLHRLFGACCALAELQIALPGHLHSRRPLRQILDRRPFI